MYECFCAQSVNHDFLFYQIRSLAITTILRIQPLRIPLLPWAKSTIAEFNRDTIFSEVGQTIRVHGLNHPAMWTKPIMGQTIREPASPCTSKDYNRLVKLHGINSQYSSPQH